jgi:hypothetical protein
MFTLFKTDEATTNARLLTADEIDLVGGGVLFALTTANGCPGIAGHLSFAYLGSLFLSGRFSFANAGVTSPSFQGHLSIAQSANGKAVAFAAPGHAFSLAISWS